jgi:hypothetical protein
MLAIWGAQVAWIQLGIRQRWGHGYRASAPAGGLMQSRCVNTAFPSQLLGSVQLSHSTGIAAGCIYATNRSGASTH